MLFVFKRELIFEFLVWHISGVARCNLAFSLESLSFFSITTLRIFWCTTSGDANRWPCIFFLFCGNTEKSLGASSRLYVGWPINSTFWPVNKALFWANVWELTSWWTTVRLFLFVFQICPKTKWTNCGVPLRIDRATMLKWNSRPMTSFAEETGHHLLRSDFFTNNFRWIWLGFKDRHGELLFYFELILTDPWFLSCDDLLNVFWGTAIIFFQHFFTLIGTNIFLSDCQIVGLQ